MPMGLEERIAQQKKIEVAIMIIVEKCGVGGITPVGQTNPSPSLFRESTITIVDIKLDSVYCRLLYLHYNKHKCQATRHH